MATKIQVFAVDNKKHCASHIYMMNPEDTVLIYMLVGILPVHEHPVPTGRVIYIHNCLTLVMAAGIYSTVTRLDSQNW